MTDDLTNRQLLKETHDAVIELSAVVLGVKGQGGLLQDMQEVKLSVTEMKLKTKDGESDVATLLQDIQYLKPKVKDLDDEIHKDGGICDKLTSHEQQLSSNNNLIKAAWGFIGAILLSILGYVISLVFRMQK